MFVKRPILPVVALAASLAAELTLEAADEAELVTLVRPSDALDEASAAFSFTAPAASEVVEALRSPARRAATLDCRATARDTAKDILRRDRMNWRWGGWRRVVVVLGSWHVELRL